MNWGFALLACTLFSLLVVGDCELINEYIRTTYENRTEEILQAFSDYEQNGMKYGDEDLCMYLSVQIPQLRQIGYPNILITSEIKRGEFNGNEGFDLILQDLSRIHIPAIIKCTTKCKRNNKDLVVDGKHFVYFYVLYMVEQKHGFAKAVLSDESKLNKTVFILRRAEIVQCYKKTYSTNRNAKQIINNWFKKAKNDSKVAFKKCQDLIPLGLSYEKPNSKWEIIDGRPVIGEISLFITSSFEVKLIGVIQCVVLVTNSSLNGIQSKYFTIVNNKGVEYYGYIYGPIKNGKEKTFTISKEIYDLIKGEKHENDMTSEEEYQLAET